MDMYVLGLKDLHNVIIIYLVFSIAE